MDLPVRDYDLIREMKNAFNHRLRLVTSARTHGRKAAPAFPTTVRTARKWLRRAVPWQTDGGEFLGAWQKEGSRSGFPAAGTFFASQHARIPPAAHTYQSAVSKPYPA